MKLLIPPPVFGHSDPMDTRGSQTKTMTGKGRVRQHGHGIEWSKPEPVPRIDRGMGRIKGAATCVLMALLAPCAWSKTSLHPGDKVLFVGDSYIGRA